VFANDEPCVRQISQALVERGWMILEMSHDKLSLEEIFLRLVRNDPAGSRHGQGEKLAS
jgi:hypothetical protein